MAAFEIDKRKLRRATEPNDEWLETPAGRAYLGVGYVLLGAIALVSLICGVLLMIAVPGIAIGLFVFASIVIYGLLAAKPAARRARS